MSGSIGNYINSLTTDFIAVADQHTSTTNSLIESNLRFVVSLAHSTLPKDGSVGLDEMISAGNQGLVEAAQKFDVTRDIKFITFAVHYIKMYMRRATFGTNLVYESAAHRSKLTKINRAVNLYTAEFDKTPSDVKLSELTGISVFSIKTARNHQNNGEASMSKLIGDTTLTISDTIPTDTPSPDEILTRAEDYQDLNQKVDELSEVEKQVVKYRYTHKLTYNEIGKILGFTPTGVKGVDTRALKKLKAKLTTVN